MLNEYKGTDYSILYLKTSLRQNVHTMLTFWTWTMLIPHYPNLEYHVPRYDYSNYAVPFYLYMHQGIGTISIVCTCTSIFAQPQTKGQIMIG